MANLKDRTPIELNTLLDQTIQSLDRLTKRVERLEADKQILQQQVNRLIQSHHHQSQSMY